MYSRGLIYIQLDDDYNNNKIIIKQNKFNTGGYIEFVFLLVYGQNRRVPKIPTFSLLLNSL